MYYIQRKWSVEYLLFGFESQNCSSAINSNHFSSESFPFNSIEIIHNVQYLNFILLGKTRWQEIFLIFDWYMQICMCVFFFGNSIGLFRKLIQIGLRNQNGLIGMEIFCVCLCFYQWLLILFRKVRLNNWAWWPARWKETNRFRLEADIKD